MATKKILAVIVAGYLLALIAGLRPQVSASLPYGFYWAKRYEGGRLVAFCPESDLSRRFRYWGTCPDWHEEMLKPVIGRPGDRVTVSPAGIALNDRLLPNTAPHTYDHAGRELAHYPYGSYLVRQGELWTVSTYNPRSFDSRYYGPIRESLIREEVRPVWTW